MSLPALDTVTGCLLIGTWASSILYTVEVIQSFYYFRHFEQDDWKFKTLVTVALLIDTLSIVGDYICVYLYTITHAGDLEYLDNIHWPIPLYGFTTGVLAALVEAFLVLRYWRFTQNTLIALFLSFGIIISFGSVFTCSLLLTLYTSFGDRPKFKIPAACVPYRNLHSRDIHPIAYFVQFDPLRLWLVTEVAVDAGIASALLWEFRKARKTLTETESVLERLNRLTAVTIQSGAAAATLAGAALISYYIKPESNIYTGFLYPLGRVYVITLLSNLNIRKTGRSFSTTDTSAYRGTTGGGREPPSITHWATDDSYGIHVHRTVHTSIQVISVESPQDRTFKSPL
ncbi:hypothetical protein B0H16DRAFT_1780846 [Mycena metata]|uniref:DUF6534 domain-containing protein n=1 Tax=Mycena metata TaxID=1033252 RepID=A0AAD7NNP6_9AGAR|nr:hypothetical protein B0H16DRAFT_1780846 [Mycena metata]